MILVFRSLHHKHMLTLFHRLISNNVGKNVNCRLLTISKNNTPGVRKLEDSTSELSGIFRKLSDRGSFFYYGSFYNGEIVLKNVLNDTLLLFSPFLLFFMLLVFMPHGT